MIGSAPDRPTATRWMLDTEKLAEALATILDHRRMSARTAATEIGVSPSTLTRLKQGKRPDADALISILAWLGVESSKFTKEAP